MFKRIENLLIGRRGKQIDKLLPGGYLYKGLELAGFPSYFAQGGIRPRYPNMTSITEDWVEAEDYGNISTLGRGRECFALIERKAIQGELKEASSDTGYRGDYFVPWPALTRLFISDTMLAEIKKIYNAVDSSKIDWNEFMTKVTVMKPSQLSFRTEFTKYLRRASS